MKKNVKKSPKDKLAKSSRSKSIKNKFVLVVGDEGAILTHYDKGKLDNRIFVSSPYSQEINVVNKLFQTYPKTPIYILADVVEQNYTQHTLPGVSAMAVKGQVKRRMAKELQKKDFNNYMALERDKKGRKDWHFLFISLANSDPFAKWFEIVLEQENEFAGVYLLPVETQKVAQNLNQYSFNQEKKEWELFVLHNKVGGFRIVAFKKGKVIFTRLAQQLIGNNIPDVIVGNLEQEIFNTIEYLKRLGFKGEAASRLTLVAGADILERVDRDSLGFGVVDLYTPFSAAEKLGVSHSLQENDRFADVLSATYFASNNKPILKFTSPLTEKLGLLKTATKAIYIVGLLICLAFLAMLFLEYQKQQELGSEKKSKEVTYKKLTQNVADMKQKYEDLPDNIDKMIDVLLLSKNFPRGREIALQVISEIASNFGENQKMNSFSIDLDPPKESNAGLESFQVDDYSVYAQGTRGGRAGEGTLYGARSEKPNKEIPKDRLFVHGFTVKINFKYSFLESDLDLVSNISKAYLEDLQDKYPDYEITYEKEPKAPDYNKKDVVTGSARDTGNSKVSLDAAIKITGALSEKKKTDN